MSVVETALDPYQTDGSDEDTPSPLTAGIAVSNADATGSGTMSNYAISIAGRTDSRMSTRIFGSVLR